MQKMNDNHFWGWTNFMDTLAKEALFSQRAPKSRDVESCCA